MYIGTRPVDETVRRGVVLSAADGGAEDFTGTVNQSDFIVVKDGSVMTLDASTITWTGTFNSRTGLGYVSVDQSNDADFTAGSFYELIYVGDGTLDSQTVNGYLLAWHTQSASELAMQQLRDTVYPTATLGTQTGVSDNTKVNLTGIVDAQSQDDLFNGWLGLLKDETDGQLYEVRITDFANTNLLASIEAKDAGVTLPTPASADKFWLIGPDPQYSAAAALTAYDPPTKAELDVLGTSALATASALTTHDGKLDTVDTVADAIKVVTDALTAAAAAKLALSAAGIISGVAQTGTLSVTQATTDLTGFADDELIGRTITFTGGTAAGQQARITDYASASGLISFTSLTTAPVNNDPFVIH